MAVHPVSHRILTPMWLISFALFGLCCAGAFAISGGALNREWVLQNSGWFAAGLIFFGGGVATAANYRSWQMARRLERLLNAVRRLLGATAGSLGRDLSSAVPLEQQSLLWF